MKIVPKVLQGQIVRLEPLGEEHHDGLKRACEADTEIWALYPFPMTGEHFQVWVDGMAKRVARGEALAYAVRRDDGIIGVSAFLGIEPANCKVEIGNTYFRPDMRGTRVNPETKFLMLTQAFASGAQCVQFRVDAVNVRSRAAVLKLGARQDGVLRRDRITWTGRKRDTVIFSILDEEWPAVRAGLEARDSVERPIRQRGNR